ncbi:glycosyltransferase 87 family protein [Saccharothrix sp. S26]|uniref:glycosyltransferase 87 family protein n=1 Tax=Saccharothrix sp. S26 TaxID=2907215 RepID=UPI001F414254|nr:glycosyltransferase 87 family protein [Saccharothrix sp. S26]MCE7000466.1 glycosyltransferase 87 family protein [Saccharothrix sp. S26]
MLKTVTTKDKARVLTALVTAIGAAAAWRAVRPSWQAPIPTWTNLPEERLQDFRDALYFPIREFLAGGNPYHPATMFEHWPVRQAFNLYQPYHLVLHAPFALPGYRVGAVAFTLASLVLLGALALLAAGRLRPHVPLVLGTAVIATLLVLSQVGKAQLYVGQVNPLIAVGAAGALLARRDAPKWAAVALALAWLKPQFGLPLAVLLSVRGSHRVALTGTAIAAAASTVVVVPLVVRGGGIGPFLDVIAANLAHAGETAYGAVDSMTAQRVDVAAVLYRITGWLPDGAEPVVLVGVLVASAILVRRLDRMGQPAAADLLTCLAVVAAIVHQPGDVLIAVPSLAAVGVVWWRGGCERDWRLGLSAVLLLVPFAHLHFVSQAIRAVTTARVDVTVDGVAVVVAWALAAAFAATRRCSAVGTVRT